MSDAETRNNQDIRAITAKALRDSQPAFDELREMFKDCSDAFDRGDDEDGKRTLSQVIQKLREFANFCDLARQAAENAPKAIQEEFATKRGSFEEILNNLLEEMEAGNLTEVGDILRFDLIDLMTAFSKLFPKIADALEI